MQIPIRGRAILHDIKRSVSRIFRVSPITFYLIFILIIFLGGFRSCGRMQRSEPPIQYDQDSQPVESDRS
ncbi:MAG: hypothetical protein KF784_08790 [Fimbriimonadaceae bacterium]|nr:hypothetical protein [Fimbriimonadaceae bacterium]